eukprot:15460879-Alexandrium_andersonii.AAC.1
MPLHGASLGGLPPPRTSPDWRLRCEWPHLGDSAPRTPQKASPARRRRFLGGPAGRSPLFGRSRRRR